MDMNSKADRTALAVALIGFGLLLTPLSHLVGGFFPGILFVFAAAVIARDVAEGGRWHQSAGMWLVGVGVIFLLGFSLPLLLILAGVVLLFGYNYRPQRFHWYHRGEFGDQSAHDGFMTESHERDEFV